MNLTFTSHLQTAIQCILASGETLGTMEGPIVGYCKTDGDDPVFRAIREQGLEVTDPLDGPEVPATMEAMQEAQAAKLEEARAAIAAGDDERDERRDARSDARKANRGKGHGGR